MDTKRKQKALLYRICKDGHQAKDHVMWFPAKQSVIKSACEKRRIKTKALNDREIPGYVAKMNKMRYESRRLGLGKNYDNWLQLTTGAHGIFYFLSKCGEYPCMASACGKRETQWGRI